MTRGTLTLLIVLALAPPLRAADSDFRWPGGELTLAAAIDRLDATGNPTHLQPGANASRHAQLPFLELDYWSAVVAVAQAFDLAVLPAATHVSARRTGELNSDNSPLMLSGGPVVLAPERADTPAPLLLPQGPLLLSVHDAGAFTIHDGSHAHTVASTAYRARLRPGLAIDEVVRAHVLWNLARDAGSNVLTGNPRTATMPWIRPGDAGSLPDGRPVGIIDLVGVDAAIRGWRLEGSARILFAHNLTKILKLRPAQHKQVQIAGLPVSFAIDAASTDAAGPDAERAGGTLSLDFPPGSLLTDELGIIMMSTDGATIETGPPAITHTDAATQVQVAVPSYDPEANVRYRIGLNVQLVAADMRLPLQMTVVIPRSATQSTGR
ncbi:MAG: hypothetical protein ACOCZK_07130 [Planctomycetota bacterium]